MSATSISETQKKGEQLEEQKKAAEAEKSSLDNELNTVIQELQKAQDDMSAKEEQIESAENELVEAKVTENNQYESMKKRIKYMYENGNVEFIEIILSAENISDFLNKTEYVTKISEYDRDMLVEFQKTVEQVQKKEEELRAEYEELSALQTTLSEKRASVETLLSNKNIQIANLESEIGENAKVLQQLIAEAQEAERRQKEAEAAQLAAQQQAMNNNAGQNNQIQAPSGGSSTGGSTSGGVIPPSSGNVVSGSGYFTHPCPGMTYQSSYFGEIREFEVGGHKGHDYAAPEGTPTYAAAAGTVLIANYSTSAGNWVVIQHDNGLVSKYMHHSALTVSAGQRVEKGQQIGYVGSTGQSTGPHLHFQVELNGVAVNPSNYM
ncbi:hypothetical protein FAEUMB_07200 [Faecalimonas umbilicata]|uniref:Peptidase M23 n=1 Tax=Faecalimonas umbilicata TaxID=1912855 RepID=A0ABQ0QUT1_9FIRM|nr:hypothetical protein FAEUMB_07200 [Faecalimonas umbilicata]